MVSTCFYFQVHQPFRLRKFGVFDIGNDNRGYFNKKKNQEIMQRVARKCYLPTNSLLMELIRKTDGKFKASFSITGTAIEQLLEYSPRVLESFAELAESGCEVLSETYYHSLSFLYSKAEFKRQVLMHKRLMKQHFRQSPKIIRNTELIYNNEFGKYVEKMGYIGVLAEGADHILGWRSPNFLYTAKNSRIKMLLKNHRLSDDIAFRFSERTWKEWPLTAEKFASWINHVNGNGNVVNLFMDYETFGEHQWASTGIFQFLEHLPGKILEHEDNDFVTPSEAVRRYDSVGELDIHDPVSWADIERDTSAWLGNKMQRSAVQALYNLEKKVLKSKNPKLIREWRKLQTSDHFYYMCTKYFADGDVHKYFNPHESPYEAFTAFMNVINDLDMKLKKKNLRMSFA